MFQYEAEEGFEHTFALMHLNSSLNILDPQFNGLNVLNFLLQYRSCFHHVWDFYLFIKLYVWMS